QALERGPRVLGRAAFAADAAVAQPARERAGELPFLADLAREPHDPVDSPLAAGDITRQRRRHLPPPPAPPPPFPRPPRGGPPPALGRRRGPCAAPARPPRAPGAPGGRPPLRAGSLPRCGYPPRRGSTRAGQPPAAPEGRRSRRTGRGALARCRASKRGCPG